MKKNRSYQWLRGPRRSHKYAGNVRRHPHRLPIRPYTATMMALWRRCGRKGTSECPNHIVGDSEHSQLKYRSTGGCIQLSARFFQTGISGVGVQFASNVYAAHLRPSECRCRLMICGPHARSAGATSAPSTNRMPSRRRNMGLDQWAGPAMPQDLFDNHPDWPYS